MVHPTPPMPDGVAAEVAQRCGDQVLFLRHRRRQRRDQRRHALGSGTIPLVAVAPSAVYIIGTPDPATEIRTQRERGRTIEVLHLGGGDPSALLADLDRQLTAVRRALGDHAVTVRRMLCLRPRTGSLVGSPTVAGVPLLTPAGAARVLTGPGDLDGAARQAVYDRLADQLPPT